MEIGAEEWRRLERVIAVATAAELAILRKTKPRAFAWTDVHVEVRMRMVVVDDERGARAVFECELAACFENRRTDRIWEDPIRLGSGPDLATAVSDLLTQAEHELRQADLLEQHEDALKPEPQGVPIGVICPPNSWPGTGLFGRHPWGQS